MRWRGLVGIILLALCPVAVAVPAEGSLLTSDVVTLPEESRVEGILVGAFAPQTGGATALSLSSPALTVTRMTARYAAADVLDHRLAARTDLQVVTYELHDVVLTLAPGDHAGWLGIAPGPGGGFAASSVAPLPLAAAASTRLGNEATDEARNSPSFGHDVARPHLAAGFDALSYRGSGALKWSGLDVVARARENTTTWETGRERSGGAAAVVEETWIVLEFADASFQLATPEGILAATGPLEATWTGPCSFFAQEGELVVDGAEGRALRAEQVVLVGTLRGSFAPAEVEGAVLLRGDWAGDLDPSPALLAAQAPASLPGAPVWLGLVAVSVLAGGAGLLLGRKRQARTTQPPLAPDEWLILAQAACERQDYAEALGWIRRARAGSPGSVRLMLEEGFCLEELGRVGEALGAYTAASALDASGEADFHAARILVEHRLDDERAESYLLRGLRKEPALALDVASDPAFARLAQRPAAREALRRARGAFDSAPDRA